MALVWGVNASLLYNDAYARVLGPRHPDALGRAIGRIGSTAESHSPERLISRFCASIEPESTSFSCSPIHDEKGNVAGALAILAQTATRRLASPSEFQPAGAPTERVQREAKDALRAAQHRLKNTLQLIASLINLQASQLADGDLLAAFEETRNRVHCIAAVHQILYASQQHNTIDIAALARRLTPELASFYDTDERVQVNVQADPAMLAAERAVPFGLLLHELLSNSCKRAFPAPSRGELTVRVGREGECNFLEVADTGIGIPAGVNFEADASLGVRLIQMLVRQLGGQLRILPGPGAHIQVRFPASLQPEENCL